MMAHNNSVGVGRSQGRHRSAAHIQTIIKPHFDIARVRFTFSAKYYFINHLAYEFSFYSIGKNIRIHISKHTKISDEEC